MSGETNVRTELAELAVNSPHLAQVLDSLLCPACGKRAATGSGLCGVCENAGARIEADNVASGKYADAAAQALAATVDATAPLPDTFTPATFTPATFTPAFLHVRRHGSFDEDIESTQNVFTLAQVQCNYDGLSELATVDDAHVYVDAVLPERSHVLLSGVLQLSFAANRLILTGYSTQFMRTLHVCREDVAQIDADEELPF